MFLKTGFEALLGTSSRWKSADKLRRLFEGLQQEGVTSKGCSGSMS